MSTTQGKELLSITRSDKTFTANGVNYIIFDKVSADRFEEAERLQVELVYGRTPKEFFATIKSAFDLLDKSKPAQAAVVLHNTLSSVAQVADGDRIHPALRMCALFVNYEGEDIRFWDEQLIDKKVNDWKAEGIDMASFFRLALNSIDGLKAIYSDASLVTSSAANQNSNPGAE